MKQKLLIICSALLMLSVTSFAQKHTRRSHNKIAQLSAAENNYDIKHLRFNLRLTDTSVYIIGDVTTTAVVVGSSLSNYVFELDSLMIIDSARVDGVWCPVTTTGAALRSIALPWTFTVGSFFTAQIFYHGMPQGGGGGFYNGITHSVSAHGTHMIYTISDPWVALNWWPCKQSANDKIDSVDMLVTVPSGVVDGSNGVLVNVDTTSTPGFATYHWQTHYPIAYYLISIAVARYAEEKYYHHFAGSADSMLIQNFFIDTATFYPLYKTRFDSIGMIIDYYDSLYGRYPFWREKYGICYTSLPGGMENQTMTTIGDPTSNTISHELAHQWFGDCVGYTLWGNTWLSEAFATFNEQMFYDRFWSPAAALWHRKVLLSSAISVPCGQVFVTDTSGPNTLFYPPTVYKKGQGVVTMLRYLAPEDSLFFKGLRTYIQTYGYRNASVADLQSVMETAYGGMNLDTFFNQWIYGKGYPIYSLTWNQIGSDVFVKLIQTQSCHASTPHFSTPLQLRFGAGSLDTTVKVYNSLDTQVFTFTWAPAMDTVLLNPDIWTVCRQSGRSTRDTTFGVNSVNNIPAKGIRVSPNPTGNNWQIEELPAETQLTLTDMSGRTIWQGKSNKGTTIIPGAKLPPGDYFLKLTGSNSTDSIKLVHW